MQQSDFEEKSLLHTIGASVDPNLDLSRATNLTDLLKRRGIVGKALNQVYRARMVKMDEKTYVYNAGGTTSFELISKLDKAAGPYCNVVGNPGTQISTHPEMKNMRSIAMLVQLMLTREFVNSRVMFGGENADYAASIHRDGKASKLPDHLRRNVILVASPTLSARDAATRNRAAIGINAPKKIYPFTFLNEKIEDVQGHEVDIIYLRDVYDAHISKLADAMNAVAARKLSLSLMVPDDYFHRIRNESPSDLRAHRSVNGWSARYFFVLDSNDRPVSVTFHMADGSLPYTHSCAVYESVIKNGQVHTPHGIFSYRLRETVGLYKIFHMTRIERATKSPRFYSLTVRDVPIVRLQLMKYKFGSRSDSASYDKTHYAEIPRDDAYKVLQLMIASLSTKNTNPFQEGMRQLEAVIHGVHIVSNEQRERHPMSSGDVPNIVVMFIILATHYKAVYDRSRESKLDIIKLQRGLEYNGVLSVLSPMKSIASIMNGFKLAKALVFNKFVESKFFKDFVHVMSLEDLSNYFHIAEQTQFIPTMTVHGRNETYDRRDDRMKFNYRSERHYPWFKGVSVDQAQSISYAESTTEVDMFTDDLERPTIIDKNPIVETSQRDEAFSRAHSERILLAKQDILDKSVPSENYRNELLVAIEGKSVEKYVESTYSEAGQRPSNVVVFKVENGSISSIFPKRISEVNHMYVFNVNVPAEICKRTRSPGGLIFKSKVSLEDGTYFTWKDMEIFISERLLNHHLEKPLELPEFSIELFEGVAGFGKTYMVANKLFTKSSLVLSATREGAEAARKELKKSGKSFDKVQVRTVDSFLMNPNMKTKHIIIDEFFMIPLGSIAMLLNTAKTVDNYIKIDAVGDRPQIPYIDRGTLRPDYQWIDSVHFDSYNFGADGLRTSLQATYNVQSYYENNKIYTTSTVENSMALMEINTYQDIPIIRDVQYYTMSQADKELMLKYLGSSPIFAGVLRKDLPVCTVHESQGSTTTANILVRTSPHGQALWDKSAHQLVAITRHTHASLFCSVRLKPGDTITSKYFISVNSTKLNGVRSKQDNPIIIHNQTNCKCGGDKHPLTDLVKKYRDLNDRGFVNPAIAANILQLVE